MTERSDHPGQIERALADLALPAGIGVRVWSEADFPAIQRLSNAEGWTTPTTRPSEALAAWRASWPALVAAEADSVVGFIRALTDGVVTTYIAELLVVPQWRGRGIGRALLDACHQLYPHTRLDLLSMPTAGRFYEAIEFRSFAGFRKSYY
jgi:GNAT superfamily N-acetyltransferase